MVNLTAYYIDDEQNVDGLGAGEIRRYAKRLSRSPELVCIPKPPPSSWEDLDSAIFAPVPDLFLIDYDLSRQQIDGSKASYRGATLATEIRNRYPHVPIVLITRQTILENLDQQTRRSLLHRMQIFDELILKSSLEEKLESTRDMLISLVTGFRLLSGIGRKDWQSFVDAVQADDNEADQMREAAPPLPGGEWTVSEISKWIRDVLLEYPGILYDSLYAATRLGIEKSAFLQDDVQAVFDRAVYTGVFALTKPVDHWWQGRLFRIAQDFITESGIQGPINLAFVEAFAAKYHKKLPQARCVWDCAPVADWVCHILNAPVKYEHTLRYYPDFRPNIMDEARVSFRAIWGSNEFQEQLLDETGAEMVRNIQALEDPCQP